MWLKIHLIQGLFASPNCGQITIALLGTYRHHILNPGGLLLAVVVCLTESSLRMTSLARVVFEASCGAARRAARAARLDSLGIMTTIALHRSYDY